MILPASILACATCLPDQGTDIARASSMAILFMVGVVFTMFGVILFVMMNFARKQRALQEPAS